AARLEKSLTMDIDGRAVSLRLARSRRARRLILRIDPHLGGATVTLPSWAGWAEAADLAVRETDWIRARLAVAPQRVPFIDGGTLPYLDDVLTIRHLADRGPPVLREGAVINVRGDATHLPRRLTDWLRGRARAEIEARARTKAEQLDKDIASITIRDTRTRWGSCSVRGGLSFSWRLVMAPEAVLDYVVAHEVAHLRHHDHSQAFWQTAATLTADMDAPRDWLRRHGPALHLYG
ncbi:MAG: SprT family zinc-dependent metalloprotease, partial [Proteobacteria bacterium]|nr:SprT family zinc-dependent metalloprotease [Pseudomonadota bacterium]